MSNQKKQIILNEIAFWKQSKMLPEKYCDYLTILYTEGKQGNELTGNAAESIKAQEKKNFLKQTIALIIVAALLVIALFAVPSNLAILVLVGVSLTTSMITSIILAKSNPLLAVALHGMSALLLLALTVRVSISYFPDNQIALYSALIVNCLFWLLSGLKLKLIYFTVSGALGLLAIIGFWLLNA